MTARQITFVRHAQSESNAQGLWQGHGDSSLSDTGRAQVAALQTRFSGKHFDIVVASDLQRTTQTAGAVTTQPERDSAWREVDIGAWDGLTMTEVLQRFPDQLRELQARKPVAIGGGESWHDVSARVDRALDQLLERMSPGQHAIVFTHGGVIASMLAGLLDGRDRWPWPLGRVRNTAVCTVAFGSQSHELLSHNDCAHLEQGPTKSGADRTVVVAATHKSTLQPLRPALLAEATGDFAHHRGARVGWRAEGQHIADYALTSCAGPNAQLRFAPLPQGHWAEFIASDQHITVERYGVTT